MLVDLALIGFHFHEFVVLQLVLNAQIVHNFEVASLRHRVTNTPSEDLPVLCAFARIFSQHVFVWFKIWHDVKR